MINRFLWKYIVRRAAKAQGFLDPINLFSRVSRFGEPSEVLAPTELLRATAVLHARGLLNAQVIQHNLDWVWPLWVNRQFDPKDVSFIPRSFSLTHINLTHRNWTAAGLPDTDETVLVDPCGLVTPFWDGWSLDAWITNKDGCDLIPSRLKDVKQSLDLDHNNSIVTEASFENMRLTSRVEMIQEMGIPTCRIHLKAKAEKNSSLVVSLRPYNPEGVSLIKNISILKDNAGWKVNKSQDIHFSDAADAQCLSDFHTGDVYHQLYKEQKTKRSAHCQLEMASAADMFLIGDKKWREITITIPLTEKAKDVKSISAANALWTNSLKNACQLDIPDHQYQFLYDAALRTLLIHTAEDVYAGPYVYKRFWFRDAVFITYTLLCSGYFKRSENIIDHFESRQTISGYFESQEGEWDSNGQVLWLIQKYCQMTNSKPKEQWKNMILKGAKWIVKKRLSDDLKELHAGLMPSGFSAEHFGPNNYYYWDDFWCLSGLRAAVYLMEQYEDQKHARIFAEEEKKLSKSIEKSLKKVEERIQTPAMPSSPYRRLDSSAVGSLVAGYPLQLREQKDARLLSTCEYLYDNCLVLNGLFHDMSHSGINPYLTLHMAQVFLRAKDPKCFTLIKGIADLASPTGQWPEAVHPLTRGGCMGDGQHTWAAAEWIMVIRNCFLREEDDNRLVLCSGIPLEWFKKTNELSFGPATTVYGTVSLTIKRKEDHILVRWDAQWHKDAPEIEISFLELETLKLKANQNEASVPFNE